MKPLILAAVAIVAALAFYFLMPLSFMHGSPFISGAIWFVGTTVPLLGLISSFGDRFEKESFMDKYGTGIMMILTLVASMLIYGEIKSSRIDENMKKSGARTMATVTDGKEVSKRRGGKSYDLTISYKANAQDYSESISVSSEEYKKVESEGLGAQIEVAYSKDFPTIVYTLLSESNKTKYGACPMDAQPRTVDEAPVTPDK